MTSIELIGRHEHYIDSRGGVAVIGRVHHRASRQVLRARGVGKGLMMLVSRRHREAAIMNSNDKTEVLPKQPPSLQAAVAQQMTEVLAPLRNLAAPQPPEPPRSRWQRFKDRVWEAATDTEWHAAARRCAGTALMWGFTATAFIVFGKAALWVLFL